jgi:hypothetical protein
MESNDNNICNILTCNNISKSKCSICKIVRYCSINCQRNDWQSHKKYCQNLENQNNENLKQIGIEDKEYCRLIDDLKHNKQTYYINNLGIKKEVIILNAEPCEKDTLIKLIPSEGRKIISISNYYDLKCRYGLPIITNDKFMLFKSIRNETFVYYPNTDTYYKFIKPK